jgi:hypothetical protein
VRARPGDNPMHFRYLTVTAALLCAVSTGALGWQALRSLDGPGAGAASSATRDLRPAVSVRPIVDACFDRTAAPVADPACRPWMTHSVVF